MLAGTSQTEAPAFKVTMVTIIDPQQNASQQSTYHYALCWQCVVLVHRNFHFVQLLRVRDSICSITHYLKELSLFHL